MGESNTVVRAYTLYRHLQQYCSHPSIYLLMFVNSLIAVSNMQINSGFKFTIWLWNLLQVLSVLTLIHKNKKKLPFTLLQKWYKFFRTVCIISIQIINALSVSFVELLNPYLIALLNL